MWRDAQRAPRLRLAPLREELSRRGVRRVRGGADEAVLLRQGRDGGLVWSDEAGRADRRVQDARRSDARGLDRRVRLLVALQRPLRLRQTPLRGDVPPAYLDHRAALSLLARRRHDLPVWPNLSLDSPPFSTLRLHRPHPHLRQNVFKDSRLRSLLPPNMSRRPMPSLPRNRPARLPLRLDQDDPSLRRALRRDSRRRRLGRGGHERRVPVRAGLQGAEVVRAAPVREDVLSARVPGGVDGGQGEGEEARCDVAGEFGGTGGAGPARPAPVRPGLRQEAELCVRSGSSPARESLLTLSICAGGIHNCELKDHRGACPPCLRADFDE